MQKKLTKQEYWETVYEPPKSKTFSITKKIGDLLKKIFGSRIKNYSEYTLWSNLYEKYLPKNKDLKIVEIGSAPGWNLVKFNKLFGYIPFGIEYTSGGAEENRRQFKKSDLNPDNVIEADFFNEGLTRTYKDYFDIVESGGFIEHFTDPNEVLIRHLFFLKPGGLLVIIIPRFVGFNGLIMRFLNPKQLAIHNLKIMNRENFLNLFKDLPLQKIYGDYYGTFNFGLFNTEGKGFKYYLHRFLIRFQVLLNILFLIFGNKGFESYLFSPYLIYIGRKK